MAEGLEVIDRREVDYREANFTDMDVDAVLARHPEVALVDELAHTNVPGSRNAKRWEDIDELLDAGIDVITTVNIQHLESLNDVVETITGVRQQETVPDEVVRRCNQIELVDMSPEALRRRLAHGNVYAADKVDAALSNYFRVGNLTALRELALLWVADRVDEGLERYREAHDIDRPWPARDRVVVALTGGPEGATLLRRGARIASRGSARELVALHVISGDGLSSTAPDTFAQQRQLTEELGGTFHTVVGDDVAQAIVDFAQGINATHIVVGVSRHGRLSGIFGPDVSGTVARASEDIDVTLVTHAQVGKGVGRSRRRALSGRRRTIGWLLAVVGPPLLTAVLAQTRDLHTLPTELLLFLTLTVGVALVGGLLPSLVAAVTSSLVANYYFTPPLHTFTIGEPENALALVIFVVVAAAVASVVDLAARRTAEAARAQGEAAALGTLAQSVLTGRTDVTDLLEQARETFGQRSAALLVKQEFEWLTDAAVGVDPPTEPDDADAAVEAKDGVVLAMRGRVLPADQQRLLVAFAAQSVLVRDRAQLEGQAREASQLAEGSAIRTALLAAVSHDLRTPLAGIKAAATSLQSHDVVWSSEDEKALLSTIEESVDRLDALIANLLNLSRLQMGAVNPLICDVSLDEVISLALVGTPHGAVIADIDESTPVVRADPGLLERVVANLVENAVRHAPTDQPVRVSAGAIQGRVEIRIVDRGSGVGADAKTKMFRPFQRLGDAPKGEGVGLGLAVARGLTEAQGGTVWAEDTPGGGLTLVVSLPAA